jgi:hypothetical protein
MADRDKLIGETWDTVAGMLGGGAESTKPK